MNKEFRIKQIEELDSFINSKQKTLDSVLESLEWTEESMKDDMKVQCPFNSEHWIHESALSHHKEICELIKDGYQKEELEIQPPDSEFFYKKSSNVIPFVIDQPTLKTILPNSGFSLGGVSKNVPKTVDKWAVQFNPEQRLSVYDFIVNSCKTLEKSKNVTLEDLMIDFEKKDNQDEKPKSHLEMLAEMRDYKRRRQSYRAKNVHITKKSYTEVMKEVIENQTNYLAEMSKCDENSKKDYEDSDERKRKYNYDLDNYDDSVDASSKYRDHSRYKKYDDHEDDYDSRKHHSRHKSSKHYSPKRKKHKRDRSKSRSPSYHKHKKSHKHKSSRD